MPVDFITPFLALSLLITVPLVSVVLGRNKRRSLLNGLAADASLVALFISIVCVPGLILRLRAGGGDAAAQYELSRWHSNNFFWPYTDHSFYWVERAAARKYPPALYALGVMYKHGHFVPKPAGWAGPSSNVFPQPKKGQPLIDEALRLGYEPTAEEEAFYWGVYRD